MNDDMYRETTLQRMARLAWRTVFDYHARAVLYLYCWLWGGALVMLATFFFTASFAIAVTAITLSLLGIALIWVYSFAQHEAYRHNAFMREKAYEQEDARLRAVAVFEPPLPADEFVQARDAILAEADRCNVPIDPDAQWQQMVDFARCSPEEFELALAEFVQVDK